MPDLLIEQQVSHHAAEPATTAASMKAGCWAAVCEHRQACPARFQRIPSTDAFHQGKGAVRPSPVNGGFPRKTLFRRETY